MEVPTLETPTIETPAIKVQALKVLKSATLSGLEGWHPMRL